MSSNPARAAVVGLLAAAAGCSGPTRAAPVEPEKARVALRATLDAWKAGRPADSLAAADPPIVAQDLDWLRGRTLADYKILDPGTPEDANLRIRAELVLRDAQGRAETKTATYVVGTDPRLTVFRALE